VVYVGSSYQKLYAFDAAGSIGCTGTPKVCTPLWTATTGNAVYSSPAVANGVVYVGSYDGRVYAFDAAASTNCSGTPKTCAPLWTASTFNSIWSSPAVANGAVNVGSNDGKLYSYGLGIPPTATPTVTPTPGPSTTPTPSPSPTSTPTATATPTQIASQNRMAVAYQVDPAHDGASLNDTLVPPLAKRWSVNLGAPISYPLIANGKVFVTVANSSGTHGSQLYALDAASGQAAWCPVAIPDTSSYWSNAAYDDGRVFVVNHDGLFQTFDARTGTALWSRQLLVGWVSSPPTAQQGTVYVGGGMTGGALLALNCNTGEVLWIEDVVNGDHSSPALSGTSVFVSYACGDTYAFARSTGKSVWNYGGCSGGGSRTPAYNQQRLFVRDWGSTPPGHIFDALSGAVLGRYDAGPIPALANGQSFVLVSGVLRASDLQMGTATWTFAGDGTLSSAPLAVGQQVYVGGTSGNLYALDAATGEQVWMANVGASIPSPDEDTVKQPLTGLNEGEGLLVVPAGNLLVAYAAAPTPSPTPTPAIVNLTSPVRDVDTRIGVGGFTGQITPGSDKCFTLGGVSGVPSDAAGVVVNLIAVGQTSIGWLTL